MTTYKPQRIRDPVHNLIDFAATAEPDQRQLEHVLWRVIQTPLFQRLRRIKQLGFGELVFPGATHTRFAHSIGVFHSARQLTASIRRSVGLGDFDSARSRVAMAAAMVHDVGHGMFSHAFEAVQETLGFAQADHEAVSKALILNSEITHELKPLGSGFASDVAELIGRKYPETLYDAVVKSQFDADRLDYMQRDSMMTGVGSAAVDAEWLLRNLDVADIPITSDDETTGTIRTLVLNSKAFHVAKSYVLSLFHLYPNVYFHKATRGAEQVFRALVQTLFALVRNEGVSKTGLPGNHPLIRFALDPTRLERATALDDTVFWGALPMMLDAEDAGLRMRARQMLDRRLLRCVDIWEMAAEELPPAGREDAPLHGARMERIGAICNRVIARKAEIPDALLDSASRHPYKRFQKAETVFNQVHIRRGSAIRDMAELSAVVASAEPFRICRAYVRRDDTVTEPLIRNIVRTSLNEGEGGNG